MKRKWILIIGLVACVGLGGFIGIKNLMVQAEDFETVKHQQEWELSGKTIEKIDVDGLDQNLAVRIEQSHNPKTKVIFEGEVPSDIQKKIKKVKATKDVLDLNLTEDKMVFVKVVGTSSELKGKLTIILGENVTLKEFKNDGMVGDTSVKVPKNMQIKTVLKTKDSGKIKKVKDDLDAKTKIIVESAGSDIEVEKY